MARRAIPYILTSNDVFVRVADQTSLDELDSSNMGDGQEAWVDSYMSSFKLMASSQAVAPNVRRTALNKPGYLWIRDALSPAWWNQVVWGINVATGNDENVGTVASPLLTFAEYRRRHWLRWLPGTETGSVSVAIAGGNLGASDYISACWSNGLRGGDQVLTVTGVATVVASGAIAAGSTPVNRATGQRNEINAGFSWATHVGRTVRLTATPTTTATVMEDLGGNRCALSEQSVNGVLGAGFTDGQDIEVVTCTTAPGINIFSASPSSVTTIDMEFSQAAAWNIRHTGVNGLVLGLRTRYAGIGGSVNAAGFRPTACSFGGSGSISINAAWFGDLTTTVNMSAGLLLINPFDRNHIASHTSQGQAFIIGENCYANISGTGSGKIGIFGLGAGASGMVVNRGARFACSNMWGSGNDAASFPINIAQAAQFMKAGDGARDFGTVGGAGLLLSTGITDDPIKIPMAQLPGAIGPGTQPGSSNWVTGKLTSGAGAVLTYCASSDAPTANQATRWGPPTSERTAARLRVNVRAGAIGVDATVTLYKNGVATAMLATIPAGSVVGTQIIDSHPILFAADDTWDVRGDAPIDVVTPGDLMFSAQIEWIC